MELHVRDVRIEKEGRTILDVERLELKQSDFTAVLGHNGSGKSTLAKLLARQMQPDTGQVDLNGCPLSSFSQREFAQSIAYLPQYLPVATGLTVEELVLQGRYPWRGAFGRWTKEDYGRVTDAIANADITDFSKKSLDTLSGGERQRAWIAMLLAQQSPLLLLDEPTSALDIAHQYDLMKLLNTLNNDEGRSVFVILHDINLACRFANRIVVLKEGRVAFDGSPSEIMNEEFLSSLYEIDICLSDHPRTGEAVAVIA